MEHNPFRNADPASRPSVSFALRVVGFLLVLIALQFAGPQIIEEVQYSLVRGRQRAERDVAAQTLDQLSPSSLSQTSQRVSRRVAPSVVHIIVLRTIAISTGDQDDGQANSPDQNPNDRQYKPPHKRRDSGSGVIVDPAGFILTNLHVVAGADDLQVVLSDGRRVRGRVQGTDPLTDLAVVKIDCNGLIAAEWGDSDDVHEGALVWAVGNPYGLESSITFGILSARDRGDVAGSFFQEFLQTDAAVNPGNSGGPLVDMSGRVVGINSMIMGESYQGIGFAVPSKVARKVYSQLRLGTAVARGWLGVRISNLESAERTVPTVDAARLAAGGVRIVSVMEDPDGQGPAFRAGVLPDDVIVRWGKRSIPDKRALKHAVADSPIGAHVKVEVIRDGQPMQLLVTVGQHPGTE